MVLHTESWALLAHPVENTVERHCVKVHTEIFEVFIDDLVSFRTARVIFALLSLHLLVPVLGLLPAFVCS